MKNNTISETTTVYQKDSILTLIDAIARTLLVMLVMSNFQHTVPFFATLGISVFLILWALTPILQSYRSITYVTQK